MITANIRDWNNSVFLGYASEDIRMVQMLYRRLKDNDLEPWLDRVDLPPGVPWEASIRSAIQKSRFFIACISSNSVSKTGVVQKELKIALSQMELRPPGAIYFIPALLENVDLPELNVGTLSLPSFQAVNVSDSFGVDRLISSLKAVKQKQV